MQTLYLVAAVLASVTGVVHSVLGEHVIFRHLRAGQWVPTRSAPPLRERHVRILWATWHLGSVFGWAFAGLLFGLAIGSPSPLALAVWATTAAYLGGAVLVLVGTKGRHPGWLALLAVASLTWMAARAA
ncbi:MAG TPA: hypothetical protein VN581_14855 [Patescibacteria group bacterium]|nr:hypothetical protein [Patescibacteria group bacterium]